jgi:hypothetical protein
VASLFDDLAVGIIPTRVRAGAVVLNNHIAITSRWHVDIRAYDDATYLHCDSGLLFAAYPERPRLIWQLYPASDLPVPKSFIRHAAVLARESVIDHAYGRRARAGCFIVDFKDSASDPTEDAPPLPRIARFADGEL